MGKKVRNTGGRPRQRPVQPKSKLHPIFNRGKLKHPEDISQRVLYRHGPDVSKQFPGVTRNSLCPCGSSKKFKQCCQLAVDGVVLTDTTQPVEAPVESQGAEG